VATLTLGTNPIYNKCARFLNRSSLLPLVGLRSKTSLYTYKARYLFARGAQPPRLHRSAPRRSDRVFGEGAEHCT